MGCCQKIVSGAPSGDGGCRGLVSYTVSQDDTTFTTISDVFVSTGKTLVTPVLAAGTYRFGIYYLQNTEWFGRGEWNVRLDGGAFIFPTTHSEILDDDNDERHPDYRSRLLALGAGAHTFVLESRHNRPPFAFIVTTFETTMELWLNAPSDTSGVEPCPCASSRQTTVDAIVVAGRTFSGRQLVTPALAAGVYRLEVYYTFQLSAGRGDFNVALDGGADIFPNSARERPNTSTEWLPRTLLRHVTLGAGAHTFELTLNRAAGAPTITLGETSFYLHRIS